MTKQTKNNAESSELEALTQNAPVPTELTDLVAHVEHSSGKELDAMAEGVSLVPEYLSVFKKPGDSWRGVFCGVRYTTYNDGGELTKSEVAVFCRDGKFYVHRGVQLINAFSSSGIPAGTPVIVTFTREEKTRSHGGGTVKIYDIRLAFVK